MKFTSIRKQRNQELNQFALENKSMLVCPLGKYLQNKGIIHDQTTL